MTSYQQRLYDLIATSNNLIAMPLVQNYMSREEAIEAGLPTTNQSLCVEQLNWLKVKILSTNGSYFATIGRESHEITKFMDSYGRPESGLFSSGKDIWPGQYSECLRATLNGGQIRGRYCLARYTLQVWPQMPSLIDPDPAIQIAVCLPETCNSLSMDDNMDTIDILVKQQLPNNLKSVLLPRSLFCLPDDRSPMRQLSFEGKIVIYSVVAWVCLFSLVTCIYEFILRRKFKILGRNGEIIYNKKNIDEESSVIKFFTGFTLRNSVKSFKLRRSTGLDMRVDMSCLNFVKVMMTFGIVISHAMILTIYKSRNRIGNLDLSITDSAKFFFSFGRFVDTFLMLLGLIMTYTLLQRFNISKLLNPALWISTYITILIRIMPLHALVIFVNRWLTPLSGSGPWWDYGLDHLSGRWFCMKSSLIQAIPPLANYGSPVPNCNPQAWFLAPYTQIAFFIPLITYIISSLPNQLINVLFVAILSLISSANVTIRLINQEVIPIEAIGDYGAFMVAVVEKFETTGYMDTLSRLGSIVIGCYSGYLLHLYQTNQIRKWPAWFASKLFNLFVIMIHLMLFLMPVYGDRLSGDSKDKAKLTMFQFALINFVMIPVWPIMNCCLIMTACTNFNKHVVVRFMAHPIWNSTSKLGLAIYLVHFEILIVSLTFFEHSTPNGYPFEALRLAGFGSVVSILLALIVYLLIEAPIAYLSAKFIMSAMKAPGASQKDPAKITGRLRQVSVHDGEISVVPRKKSYHLGFSSLDKMTHSSESR